MTTFSTAEYGRRVVRVVSQVISQAESAALISMDTSGWFTLAAKDGAPIVGIALPMSLSAALAADYRHHSEEQIRWLRSHDLLTSGIWDEHNVSEAVAATGYDFFFSFASALSREWNEAIAVVSAVRMQQFSQNVIDDSRWHLQHNPCIKQLLEAAHWTE